MAEKGLDSWRKNGRSAGPSARNGGGRSPIPAARPTSTCCLCRLPIPVRVVLARSIPFTCLPGRRPAALSGRHARLLRPPQRRWRRRGGHRPGAGPARPHRRPLPSSDGRTITADERYFGDSILLPRSEIVAGYGPIMPSFLGQIGEEDLMTLIACVQLLGRADSLRLTEGLTIRSCPPFATRTP